MIVGSRVSLDLLPLRCNDSCRQLKDMLDEIGSYEDMNDHFLDFFLGEQNRYKNLFKR